MLAASSEEHSSSPIVLGIAASIVVSVLGGWLLLGNRTATVDADEVNTSTLLALASPKSFEAPVDVDAALRKARLSADAGLLVSPGRQNALYFYSRVLAADPTHEVAGAELDAVMAGISLLVDDHLAADELAEAYDIAQSAARLMPSHPLVDAMRDDLNEYSAALAAEATVLAQDGDDAAAMEKLAVLEALPGLNADFVAAAQQEVLEAQQSRSAAAQEQQNAERLKVEQADLAWQQQVRDAIAAGNLLTPEGASARDVLEARDVGAELKELMTAELQTAVIAASRGSLEAGEPADAEAYLVVAGELGAAEDVLVELGADVEQALIDQAGSSIVALTEFTGADTPPAKYPRRANRRNIDGFVDVVFTVTSTGETSDIDIVRAEPENIFDESVMEAVSQWTFEPRQFRGQPIDQRTAARVVFNLE